MLKILSRQDDIYICLNLSKPGQRKVTSVFLNKYVTARIGLQRHKKGEKKERNTALKGREERGEEKKRLTFPLVFISWSLDAFTAIFALNGENFLDLVLINSDIYIYDIKAFGSVISVVM